MENVCTTNRPWRVRVNGYINHQASNPHGLFGRLLGFIWRREHRDINRMTLHLLQARPGAHLLEIGCGPGETLREAVRGGCSAVGLDVSATMVSIARKRNRAAIRDRSIEVWRIKDGTLDLDHETFDGAYSVHCVYFWWSPNETLSHIAHALKPGGRLVLAFTPESPDVPSRFRDETYRFYSPEEIEALLVQSGFQDIRTQRQPEISRMVIWMIAAKAR